MEQGDLPEIRVKEVITVRKFDGDWTQEQIEAGEADEAVVEVITLEDGVITERRSGPVAKKSAPPPEENQIYGISCMDCGAMLQFDEIPESKLIACSECGAATELAADFGKVGD